MFFFEVDNNLEDYKKERDKRIRRKKEEEELTIVLCNDKISLCCIIVTHTVEFNFCVMLLCLYDVFLC